MTEVGLKVIDGPNCRQDPCALDLVAKGRGSLAIVYGSEASRYRLFSSAIDWERVLFAYQGEAVVGFLAFQWKRRGPYRLSRLDFSREFGFLNGTGKWLLHCLLESRTWLRGFYIYGLKVEPSARRHGVATALVEQAESLATRLGARSLSLDIYESNQVAFEFYRHNGFVIDRRLQFKFLDRLSRFSSILYLKKTLIVSS